MMRRAKLLLPLLGLLISSAEVAAEAPSATEILWDSWGVPHVYADQREGTLYALGWAQMRAHGAAIAELYAAARGRAAAHEGESAYRDDVLVHQLDIPERAAVAWAEQEPRYRAYLAAFVRGLNDYAAAHPKSLPPALRALLPFTPVDVLAHVQRVLLTRFLYVDRAAIARYEDALSAREDPQPRRPERSGSNGYAIGAARSASGHAMLVINPHLPWSGEFVQFEAQIVEGEHFFYGSMLIGQPYFALGFSENLGWTHTVNGFDSLDTYELTLRDGGYELDGERREFEERTPVAVKVRGEQTPRSVRRLSSLHGPVVFHDPAAGRALAVRYSEGASAQLVRRYWQQVDAQGVVEFEASANRDRLGCFNTLYADRHGDVLFRYEGVMPRRNGGDYASWRGVVSGRSAADVWRDVYDLSALPRLLNPPSGFVQNANDPPWYASLPALSSAAYPPYIAAPELDYRAQQSLRRVAGEGKISFERLVELKQENTVELAERFLPALLAACAGEAALAPARRVLAAWDRTLSAGARGAVLFLEWVDAMQRAGEHWPAESWSAREPLATPRGLAEPELACRALQQASAAVRVRHGKLAIPYGSAYRLRVGKYDLPASAGSTDYGVYSAAEFLPAGDGTSVAWGGDSFVAVVEFATPPRAVGLLTYGNASRAGSRHVGDQLPLFSRRELRSLWLTRAEVEQHLADRERLSGASRGGAAPRALGEK